MEVEVQVGDLMAQTVMRVRPLGAAPSGQWAIEKGRRVGSRGGEGAGSISR